MNVGFRIPAGVDTEPLDRKFDLRQYLNFVWRNWLLIASVTALAFLVAVIYLMRATPRYTASTQVLLEQRDRAPGLDAAGNDGRFDNYYAPFSYLDNQLAILQSESLLRRVVISERLVPPSIKEPQGTAEQKADPAAAEGAIIGAINRLRGALAVSRKGQAQVLTIAITWEDPAQAAQLANAVADAYVVDQLDARLESAKRASGWLSDRLIDLRRQLGESEQAVASFRKE